MSAEARREYRAAMTDRTALMLGTEALRRLEEARVIVVGLGGVGSWCAEALVRTGIGHLSIVDYDRVSASNLNRQAQAFSTSIGRPKAEALAARLREIDPYTDIASLDTRFTAASANEFALGSYDCVVDAIDDVDDKIALIASALASGAGLYSSMGAAWRRDPTRVRTAPLSKTQGCPLARAVRRRLKTKGIPSEFLCVYSDEPSPVFADRRRADLASGDKRANGSLVQVTAVFGLTLAALVVNRIAGDNFM